MQLLPETAQRYGRFDLYEPNENIRVGVQHLKRLMAQFRNDLRLTLAAYNAGAEAVAKHGGIPPFPETIEYIGRVLRHYRSYRVSTDRLPEGNASASGAGKTP
jgi:soluble lytic murein transglycosylase-like protein